MPTVAVCVRRFCLECLGATSRRNAFDCLSAICPLYVCMPFRGKPMRKAFSPGGRFAEAEELRAKELARIPKRRPSKRMIAAYCRHCQPEDRSDCGGVDCALYPWRPWQRGGQPKVRRLAEPARRALVASGSAYQFGKERG